jgi:hypothetical protein
MFTYAVVYRKYLLIVVVCCVVETAIIFREINHEWH